MRSSTAALSRRSPPEEQVTPRLAALVRRQLIRPDRAQLPGEDGFRFRHLLIRDTAYEALPKSTRADLHERFADWLERTARGLVELDEILGYHLEQAALYTRGARAAGRAARPACGRSPRRPPGGATSGRGTSERLSGCSSGRWR